MKKPTVSEDMRIVKCGCGLPMRAKDWAEHWRSCRVGSYVPVTKDDVDNLKANEASLREKEVSKP